MKIVVVHHPSYSEVTTFNKPYGKGLINRS